MKQRFATVLVVAALSRCSSDPAPAFTNVLARPACAPNDGPAVQFDMIQSGAQTTLQVHVYRSREEADGKSWSVAPPHEFGLARLCPLGQGCENASSGEIRFAPGSQALRGVVDLRFARAGRLRGTFDAAWLEIAVICG